MRASRKAKGISSEEIDHVIIGKPNPFAVGQICKDHNITDKSKCIMVGDNPATDM
jgi:ribonucleotide monophosphatase NagD (HAD superfamily)